MFQNFLIDKDNNSSVEITPIQELLEVSFQDLQRSNSLPSSSLPLGCHSPGPWGLPTRPSTLACSAVTAS